MSEKDKDNSDVVYDEDEGRDGFGRSGKEKKLAEKLKKCKEEKREYLAGWQRAKADLVNQKRDFEERSVSVGAFAKESLIEELLSVLDSFEMAFKNKESWEKVDEGWRKGVEYIHSQFDKILREHGLEMIDTEGQIFDPLLHESVETVPTENEGENSTVAEVVQSGYRTGERVIRPAKVKVFEYQN